MCVQLGASWQQGTPHSLWPTPGSQGGQQVLHVCVLTNMGVAHEARHSAHSISSIDLHTGKREGGEGTREV